MKKVYRLQSTGLVHTPGMVRNAMRMYKHPDADERLRGVLIMASYALPAPIMMDILDQNGKALVEFEDDTVTVTVDDGEPETYASLPEPTEFGKQSEALLDFFRQARGNNSIKCNVAVSKSGMSRRIRFYTITSYSGGAYIQKLYIPVNYGTDKPNEAELFRQNVKGVTLMQTREEFRITGAGEDMRKRCLSQMLYACYGVQFYDQDTGKAYLPAPEVL